MLVLLLLQWDVPYDALSKEDAAAVRAVLDREHLTVDLDRTRVDSTLDVYTFCMERLDFTGKLAGVLSEATYDITCDADLAPRGETVTERMRRTFLVDDGDGMVALMTRVYAADGRWIFVSRGRYEMDLLTVKSRAVIIVNAVPDEGALDTTARIFMRVDEGVGSIAAGLFEDAVRDAVRDKSTLFIAAARTATEAAQKDPARVSRLAGLADGIDRGVLADFRKKCLNRSDGRDTN